MDEVGHHFVVSLNLFEFFFDFWCLPSHLFEIDHIKVYQRWYNIMGEHFANEELVCSQVYYQL